MREKSTEDLSQELLEQSDLNAYIKENRTQFTNQSIGRVLTELHRKRRISKAALARKAGMSEVYLHQVFSGRRHPSRDRLICLCVGLEATLDETQQMLRLAGYAQLYPRFKRDSIISHGILHGMELNAINDRLFAENEKTLF